jgi:hypothetical protein
VLAALIRLPGDFDRAEAALHDAFAAPWSGGPDFIQFSAIHVSIELGPTSCRTNLAKSTCWLSSA